MSAPWHTLRGAERIFARADVIRAAQRRDPTGDTWTREEHRAADEDDAAYDACESAYPLAASLNLRDCPDDLRADLGAA